MVMVALNVQLSALLVTSTVITVMRISAVVVIPARIAANQADGVTNAITAVNVLKPSVIVVTVALIVQQYVLTVTRNVQTALILISVADVTNALTASAGKIYSAVTVKPATNVQIMFVLVAMVVVLVL